MDSLEIFYKRLTEYFIQCLIQSVMKRQINGNVSVSQFSSKCALFAFAACPSSIPLPLSPSAYTLI